MCRQLGGVLGVLLICATMAQAAAIDVTTSVDAPYVDGKYQINIGETHTLSVFGQLKGAAASSGNGIFSWDVDLRVGDTGILGLLTDTVDRSGWTDYSGTSSDGTPTAWGLDAIYDTGEGDTEFGVGGPVRLFSIDFTGVSVGESTLMIEPDDTVGTDFLTWNTELGGDYAAGFATINVVPEPASISLLVTGALALLWLWQRRFK